MVASGHTEQGREDTPTEWTILSLLDWSTGYLKDRGFDEARLHAELLLSHVLALPRIALYTQFDRPLQKGDLQRFKELFRRRLAHEPLQYILGETEFMGLKLYVDPGVLIPRPETEVLVEKASETLKRFDVASPEILDIGTGSGNIAAALAHAFPHAQVTAVDVSADALRTAERNVTRYGLSNVRLAAADVFGDLLPGRRFDLIVSNPPYVATAEIAGLPPEIRDYEPRMATCDEHDGFRFIARIAQLARHMLTSGGYLFMEIGYGQSDRARSVLRDAGFAEVEVFNDYSNVPRVMKARQPAGEGEIR